MTKRTLESSSKTSGLFKRFDRFKPRLRTLGTIIYLIAVPLIFTHDLFLRMWQNSPARAWDGTGHYGIAQIYDQTIFPDTFGWTHAYFGGMPFPNFYPPLFFWCVALLHHTHLLSFETAFKLMVMVPIIIMPAVIWLLAWTASEGNRRVAFWAGFVSWIPLVSAEFGGHLKWASGLDYFSTFAVGIYTQPLGFILLISWYIAYVRAQRGVWRFVLSCLLLALAVLANYINGVMATLFVVATVIVDAVRYYDASSSEKQERRAALLAHAASPVISAALALFWLVPMLSTYEYLVTRPFTLVIITRGMLVWYLISIIGMVYWLRHPSAHYKPYVAACFALAFIILFAAQVAPRWYPLQANRFSPTLNFLLTVPVAYAITMVVQKLKALLVRLLTPRMPSALRLKPYLLALLLLWPVLYAYSGSRSKNARIIFESEAAMAFYPQGADRPLAANDRTIAEQAGSPNRFSLTETTEIASVGWDALVDIYGQDHAQDTPLGKASGMTLNQVLQYAREHRDGRYFVELPNLYATDFASFDSHALNSYLGAQGNETMTVIFREASANTLFMYPQRNALSFNPDIFGFSSVLADDLDFAEQPLAKHLERARLLGVKYLVVYSAEMKENLGREPIIRDRRDFGSWSVFELGVAPPPPVRTLPYRPALLVTDFTVKGRYSNESNYIRFAEEQFFDGWFDVLLVRSPTKKLDELGSLSELKQFGALILDTYEYDNADLVYRQLREFAQSRPLILLVDDNMLFHRIKYALKEFPLAQVIERAPAGENVWLDHYGPRHRYQTSGMRQQWAAIRKILEEHRIETEPVAVDGQVNQNTIQINYHPSPTSPPSYGVPVLLSTTFHPNWQREDGKRIYAANPMYMLAFVGQSTRLNYARRPLDRLALWLTLATILGLLVFALWGRRRLFKHGRNESIREDLRSRPQRAVED